MDVQYTKTSEKDNNDAKKVLVAAIFHAVSRWDGDNDTPEELTERVLSAIRDVSKDLGIEVARLIDREVS